MQSRSTVTREIPGLAGWRHLALTAVGSTNDEALRLANQGQPGRVWVTAQSQETGKARRGRDWASPPGNLYASLLLIDPAPSDQLRTLPLVVSLALHKSLAVVAPSIENDLRIKWPNDVLLGGKKLSGILLEAANDKFGRLAVVIGCGVNCAHYPDNPLYPATALRDHSIDIKPEVLFLALARSLAKELRIWAQGAGFSIIRKEWLERTAGLGGLITARFPDSELTGTFIGLDGDGYLLLEARDGTISQISAADIFFGSLSRTGA